MQFLRYGDTAEIDASGCMFPKNTSTQSSGIKADEYHWRSPCQSYEISYAKIKDIYHRLLRWSRISNLHAFDLVYEIWWMMVINESYLWLNY